MSYKNITDEQWVKFSDQMNDFAFDVIPKLWEMANPEVNLTIREDTFNFYVTNSFTEDLIGDETLSFEDYVERDLRHWYPGELLEIIENRVSSFEKLIELYKSRLPELNAWCDEYEEASEEEQDAMTLEWDNRF